VQAYFQRLVDEIHAALEGAEIFTCHFSAEESDFVRFNHGAVGQAGTVTQRALGLDLIEGRRHAAGSMTVTGDLELDAPRARALVCDLRERRAWVPEDPFLSYATEVHPTVRGDDDRLLDAWDAVDEIRRIFDGRDLVGVLASGGTHAGFANSFGQRNWQSRHSFNFDWSLYRAVDKAVKESHAGFEWDAAALERKAHAAGERLRALDRAPRSIPPGRYRVFLAPAALDEIVRILSWGGFGLRAHRTRTTPLLRMITEGARLHPSVQLTENTAEGLAPDFQEAGFLRPDHVALIRDGTYAECLVSPRSAVEFGAETNGASGAEVPLSIDLAPGRLSTDRALTEMGTGIYVSNLWYLNYSDRSACRTTGMTRFATFWVRAGTIEAPLEVMRFDDTLFRILGERLVGLTAERETLLDPGSYGRRSLRSARLPGALVDDFTLTL
jgi:predicted Zn-dependent protease